MSFAVHELPRAQEDKQAILEWLLERSRQGAAAWLDAYDDAIARLRDHADTYGQALENDDCRRSTCDKCCSRLVVVAPTGSSSSWISRMYLFCESEARASRHCNRTNCSRFPSVTVHFRRLGGKVDQDVKEPADFAIVRGGRQSRHEIFLQHLLGN